AVGSSGLPGLVRPVPVHLAAAAAVPTAKMGTRLRARAGLRAAPDGAAATITTTDGAREGIQALRSNGDGGGSSGAAGKVGASGGIPDRGIPRLAGGDGPMTVLVETNSLVRGVFETADEKGYVDERGLLESQGGPAEGEGGLGDAVCSLLDRGLAVVAYSVVNAAYLRGVSSIKGREGAGTGDQDHGAQQEREDRALLDRAETSLDQFCKQVRLSPEFRVQARLSWLLDRGANTAAAVSGGASSSLCISTAAAALLCPRASACLAADPDLLALAGAVLATHSGGGGSGGGRRGPGDGGRGTGPPACRRRAFLPLGEELLRAAGGRARGRLLEAIDGAKKLPRDSSSPAMAEGNGSGISGGAEGGGVGGRGGGHSRDGQVALLDVQRQGQQEQQQQQQQLFSTVSTPAPAGDEQGARRRRRGCTVWETPRGMGLTPKTLGADRQTPHPTAGGEDDTGSSIRAGHRSRARGHTVWETPRGVGLTPKTPGARSRERYGGDAGGG
ncbi:unnamed protein product, partial [Scytosiphon promiscuus]